MPKPHLALAIAGLLFASAPPSFAQPSESSPSIALQGADFYRFQIGRITVTVLSDGTVPQDLHQLLTATTPTRTDGLLAASFLRNPVEASINAFLITLPDRLVLVDAGSGELFGPGNGGKLINSLAAAGYAPDQITDVLITHVHTDHSGGLVADGRRVFENATIHVGQPDIDFFLDAENAERSQYDRRYFDEAVKTLKPYVDADRVQGFDASSEVVPGITGTLHPGHTPGSAFYTLASDGERLVFVGDIIHVAAVQFPEPGVTIVYDVDPSAAAETRTEALSEFADGRVLIAAPHLSFPGVGHVRRDGSGYRWVPVDYGNRAGAGR